MSKTLFATTALLGVLIGATHALNYVYQVGLGRFLGPQDYSEFAFAIAIFATLYLPIGAIETQAAVDVARLTRASGIVGAGSSYRDMIRIMAPSATAVALFIMVCAPLLQWTANLRGVTTLLIVAVALGFATYNTAILGTLQGLERFRALGLMSLLNAVGRVLAGFLLVLVGFGIAGAVIGIVVGGIIACAYGRFALRDLPHAASTQTPFRRFYGRLILTSLLLLAFTFVSNLDLLVIRRFVSDVHAGQYAAASVLSKAIIFAVTPVIGVLVPRLSSAQGEERRGRAMVLVAFVSAAAVAGTAAVVLIFVSPIVVELFLGSEYSGTSALVSGLAWSGFAFALSSVLVYCAIVAQERGSLFVLCASAVATMIMLLVWHDSLTQIVQVMQASAWLLLMGLAVSHLKVSSVRSV